jgi:hypothetical protein
MKKIILILMAITAIVCGCNKTKQIMNKIYGDYTLTSYTVNGVDSLSLYKDSLGENFKFYFDDYQEKTFVAIYGQRNDGKEGGLLQTWALINKNTIEFYPYTSDDDIGTGPFGNHKRPIFEILELKNILRLRTNFNEKEYIVELESD